MFRTGSHWLQVCQGRHGFRRVNRGQRLCPSCPRAVEDEIHAIFHCPAYNAQRVQFADLFVETHSLRSFLVNNPTHRVALFLTACRAVGMNRPKRAALRNRKLLCQVRHDSDSDCDLIEEGHLHQRDADIDSYDSS